MNVVEVDVEKDGGIIRSRLRVVTLGVVRSTTIGTSLIPSKDGQSKA